MDEAAFPSPEGKQVAGFKMMDDGWYYLTVTDSKTGQTSGTAKLDLPPVFSVEWTRDQKTIVVVSHVAHGSTATLFHLLDGKWSSSIFYPPDFNDDSNTRVFYNVAKVEAGDHTVTLTYELEVGEVSAADETHDKHYQVEVKLDPDSNKIISSTLKPVK